MDCVVGHVVGVSEWTDVMRLFFLIVLSCAGAGGTGFEPQQ